MFEDAGNPQFLEIYQDYLIKDGVSPKQIIAINFEDLEFENLTDYNSLYKYIKEHLIDDKKNYIFLDEIQHVNQYEKVVDSIFKEL